MAFGDSILWGKSDISRLHGRINKLLQEMATLKKSVSDGKTLVANAITAFPGVTINEYSEGIPTFNGMAGALNGIGKHNGEAITLSGTGENGGHWHSLPTGYWYGCAINAWSEYNAGYSNGQASVSQAHSGNAAASDVLSGKTFQSATAGTPAGSGNTTPGTMSDYSKNIQTITLSADETGTSTHDIANGYHTQMKVDASKVYKAGQSGKYIHKKRITISSNYADDKGSAYPIPDGTTHLCFTKYGGNSQSNCYVGSSSKPKMYHFTDADGTEPTGTTQVKFIYAHMYNVKDKGVTQVYGNECDSSKIIYVDCYKKY